MRAVVQRVSQASVSVEGEVVGEIGAGFMVLLGAGHEDSESDCRYLAEKIAKLRVFNDEAGKMNLSVKDIGGEILAISQFTLFGDARKGRRPSFVAAMAPEPAKALYGNFVEELRKLEISKVAVGVFGADMKVSLCNDGPVTMLLDSKKQF